MAEEPKTAGSGTETLSGSSAREVTPQSPSDRGDDRGWQKRVDGLVAERDRWKERAEQEAHARAEIAEKNKTEQERLLDATAKSAVDQFRKAELEPLQQRVKKYEAYMAAENERLLGTVGKDVVPPDFTEWDISVQNSFLKAVSGGRAPTPPVGGAPNPSGAAPKRTIAGSEFRAWQSTNMYNPEARAKYEDAKEDMRAAYMEGRIDWTK